MRKMLDRMIKSMFLASPVIAEQNGRKYRREQLEIVRKQLDVLEKKLLIIEQRRAERKAASATQKEAIS